jgi:hypothetical protein
VAFSAPPCCPAAERMCSVTSCITRITSCFVVSADTAAASCVGPGAKTASAGVAASTSHHRADPVLGSRPASKPTGGAQPCSEWWCDSTGYETTELAFMTATNTLCSGALLRAPCEASEVALGVDPARLQQPPAASAYELAPFGSEHRRIIMKSSKLFAGVGVMTRPFSGKKLGDRGGN